MSGTASAGWWTPRIIGGSFLGLEAREGSVPGGRSGAGPGELVLDACDRETLRVDRSGAGAYRAGSFYTGPNAVDILLREQSESGVLTLVLHRPERKNAIDLALAHELTPP